MSDRPLPSWHQELERALQAHCGMPESRYCQLATVDIGQLPTVRTVVYRGIEQTTGDIVIHTDIRSEKVSHILACPKVQLCWYFSKTREQFRLSGEVKIIRYGDKQHEQMLQSQWDGLSDAAKQSYFGQTPGAILGLNDEHQTPCDGSRANTIAHQNFALLLLSLRKVEHLQLTTTPHSRHLYDSSNGIDWELQKIHP